MRQPSLLTQMAWRYFLHSWRHSCAAGSAWVGPKASQIRLMRLGTASASRRCRIRVVPTWWEQGGQMPTIEERVAYLEGTVGEHTRAFGDLRHGVADVRVGLTDSRTDTNQIMTDLRTGLTELRSDMNHRFAQMDLRFAQIDERFVQIEGRFAQIDGRFDHIETRFSDIQQQMARRFDQIDQRFTWMLGTQLAVLLAVIASLSAAYYQ